MSYTDQQREQLRQWAINIFLLAAILALLYATTGCGTFNAPVQNSCVIDAVSYQSVLITQGTLDRKHIWNKIMFITHSDGLHHAINIYRSNEGNYYWHDARHGSSQIPGITEKKVGDARTVSAAISPTITWAEYEVASK